ncbi:class I SAM-dependent methyltransferase [Thalassotalea sp. M1531]|uniref:Class I SAM-dependent methyltransferase n=1 Tax=Thalassotalea algicola TaxID=2716224 RepID=A0A7Y0Q6X1_9GAMM|nr:cyclopropane-fatty-acyl-phospholipid synthase family protein [Thalassotalea algicola]NMP31596.1 class I SAM-dependent methyltransferase [Thalassotalea algicola]
MNSIASTEKTLNSSTRGASSVTLDANSWLITRCRNIVFRIFSQLPSGYVEVIDRGTRYSFGKDKNDPLKATIEIHNPKTYLQLVKGGSIGASEAYIDNMWDTPDLTSLIRVFARAQKVTDKFEKYVSWLSKLKNKWFHFQNRNSKSGSKKNILAHYDLGNELYTRFLDKEMMYSAAIYPNPSATLEQAQIHKLEKICQRLSLTETDHLLEIGTGWGGLAIYAAKNYGCKVTTTTISDAQYCYAKSRVEALGLAGQITLLKNDYRNLTGQYDKLVSIEMIEAVGYNYMDSFFKQCNARLKPGGKLLIQAITIADQRFEHYLNNVDFIQRYIFPGGFLPSINLMANKVAEKTDLVIEELHDIGLDYAKTLAHWRQSFLANWPGLTEFGYDEKFKRLWLFYLGYCEGAFLERSTSTVHLIARK